MTRLDCSWLRSDSTQSVFDLFERHSHLLYCVGGCVRNGLLGLPATDIDMSTSARPEVIMEMCAEAGFKATPTGFSHGTITVVAQDTVFEITTFRKDVETDGRRAVVSFSDSLDDDARRRDFTMNALYTGRDGLVLDPVGGVDDLYAGRVRFIDDAQLRIREDYLRILRYFRFFARFSKSAPDPDTLDAIARNADGLAQLSSERVTAELLSLLSVANPSEAIGMMQQTGVLHAVLPGADLRFLAPLVALQMQCDLALDPMPRLACLASQESLARLRLSNSQFKQIATYQTHIVSTYGAAALGAEVGEDAAHQVLALRASMAAHPLTSSALKDATWGATQTFPVGSADLQPQYSGPALGKRLAQLRVTWLDSDLTLSKDALLSIPDG